ncbi:MAG: hypothetical protein RLZZ15_363 [Verrucomicrobiota bacterium]|jgi:hypothetical protein
MEKPWKVVLAFVGVFIAGAVFGGLFSLRIGQTFVQERERKQGAGRLPLPPAVAANPNRAPANSHKPPLVIGPQAQAANLLRRFAERLDLTPDQRDRVMPLIQRATLDFRRQQQDHFRDDTITLQRLQEDIRKELTLIQISKLEQMEEKQRKILDQRQHDDAAFGGDGPRPNPGPPAFAPGDPNNPASRGPTQPPRKGPNSPKRQFQNSPQGPNPGAPNPSAGPDQPPGANPPPGPRPPPGGGDPR